MSDSSSRWTWHGGRGDELMHILDDIGLGDLKERFRENLITLDQVKDLSEEDFSRLGVKAIGIKLKIKNAVEDYKRANGLATSSSVVAKFMELQKKKVESKTLRHAAQKKSSRRVRVGWKHLVTSGQYKIMTGKDGGGLQIVDLNKDWTIDQAEKHILEIYFPGGKSVNLKLSDLKYYLASFTNQPIKECSCLSTVGQYFDHVQSHPVRWYLHTQLKHASGDGDDKYPLKRTTDAHDEYDDDSDEDLPDITWRIKHTASTQDEGVCTQRSDEATNEQETFIATDTPTVSFKRRPQFVRRQRPDVQQDAYSSYVDLVTVSSEEETVDSDSDVFQVQETSPPKKPPVKLFDVLGTLEVKTDGPPTKFNITRSNPLDGARRAINRKIFRATNHIDVRFADDIGVSEGAVDSGGPTRELFRLILQEIKECLAFQGDEHKKQFALHSEALRNGLYRDIGILMAMAITHGGQWPGFFHPTAYKSFAFRQSIPSATVDDICDLELKDMVIKLQQASSLKELEEVVDANYTMFSVSGCYRAMVSFSEKQRDQLATDILHFLVVGRNQQAITQFSEGLEACGVLQAVLQYPDQFMEVFCQGPPDLKPEMFEAIFSSVNYSEKGSNTRKQEERIYTYWCDFLMDIEDGKVDLTLEELLAFTTGSNQVPFLGFGTDPTLEFDVHAKYPTANTCGLNLRLPVVAEYQTFLESMVFGIKNSPGFGKA